MAKSKNENIWKFLSTNDFKDQVPQKFHCVTCKNIAIEPYKSSCGCRFCSLCIQEYLKDGRRRCPGGGSICCEEILEIDINVAKDFIIASKIGRLVVKCIHVMCEVRCKLEMMDDHMRVCDMSPTKCPYERIGCQVTEMSMDNIKCHYDNEWFSHSQLLIEAIDNLKNEVNGLRNIMEIKDQQINKFNEDYERDKIIILEMKQQIDEQRRDIDEQRNEIDVLKDPDGIRNSANKVMKEDLKIKDLKVEYQNKSLNDLEENHESIVREMASVNVKIKDFQIYDEREFLWRVDNVSEMRDHSRGRRIILWRYSVKFELYLGYDGGDLYFKWRILKGDFDDYILWPMEHKITLSIINQTSMETHKRREYSRDSTGENKGGFDKPKDGGNNEYYFIFGDRFMTAAEGRDSPGVILNDSLIVSFKFN